ncbi:serine-threonine protein kinase, plant-type, putative [Ricinus communis]|uniref:non-specific serine/threonine protein kinase n=1 Tax=Ricinus communis TaxID=3988 RepID=B9RQM6_RICCO|nr:serine-threonine protein kinase, plant-type, putative [Ricinus communis]
MFIFLTYILSADKSNFTTPPLVTPLQLRESSDLIDIQAARRSCEYVDSSESASELPDLRIEQSSPDSLEFLEPTNIEPTPTEDTAVDSVEELPTSERSPIIEKCQYRPRIFTYDEMGIATGYFSHVHLLGEGGFAHVYKGVLRNTGEVVAIKKFKYRDGQREDEFEKEIKAISSVRHRNLVKLIGYCINGPDRLLVLEFVPNNSLKTHLHGKKTPTLEWPKRINIAIGSAKGLEYLHEDCNPKIIHRDIKADNILLDADFKPKLADFANAKFFPDSVTHLFTDVRGTSGYIAPEYADTRMLTDKSDVYSYGVLLLELITGKQPDDDHTDIVGWVVPQLDEGNYDFLVDPNLQEYDPEQMRQLIICAAACVRKDPDSRPKMSQIVRVLEGATPVANDL